MWLIGVTNICDGTHPCLSHPFLELTLCYERQDRFATGWQVTSKHLMYTFNDKLAQLTPVGQRRWYLALAEAALEHYGLGSTTATFIQHNAGIVFRVVVPRMGRAYLLKLHARIGGGANPTAEQLEA